jgi:hypothetical protein
MVFRRAALRDNQFRESTFDKTGFTVMKANSGVVAFFVHICTGRLE